MDIPDKRLDRFHVGQVWESNKGHLWRVEKIENGQAVMRKGEHGEGRVKRKPWDGVMTMVLFYDPEYSDVGIDYFSHLTQPAQPS